MQRKSSLAVLVPVFLIFLYYTWEHFTIKKQTDKAENPDQETVKPLKKLPKQDRVNLAIEYEFEITKDPSLNIVPRERLLSADSYRKQKTEFLNSRTSTAIPGINWEERGPNNVGGRTRAIMYDLNDVSNGYKKVFAGSVGGGLWVTNDITAVTPVWNRINDFMANLAISTLAQDPSNPQNMYAGTGEGWFNLDAIRGLGIFKSSDGGNTWSQLASTNNSTFNYVQKIVVTNAGIILAATRDGGVQRSTNGGNTWTKVLGNGTGGGSDNRAADLEIGADGNIYASVGIFTTLDGIYRSTDGGVNWTKIYTSASDERRIELSCAASNPDVIYALIEDNDNPNPGGLKKIMKSTDATAVTPTWTNLTSPNWCDQGAASTDFTRGQAWYDLTSAVDPTDDNTVYVGGVDILKSTTGGSSWGQISKWSSFGGCSGNVIHADIHAIVFKPGSSTEMLIGNDGGMYRTTDGGTSYSSRVTGYNVTQYYACAIHPVTTNYFLAGAQDNGTQKFTSGGVNATSTPTGGDGAFCHIDQTNGNLQITSYVYNNYFISTNGGSTFTQKFFGNTGSFINPTDYDDAADILYGGNSAGTFFRWNDAGTAGNSTNNVTVTAFSGAGVRHVSVSPLTANRVYFGLSNGSVVMVDNANTGTNLTGTVIKTGTGSVSCIAIDPANEDHMLVTYSNYGVTSVFESNNATQGSPTWTAVEGNLPDMPVRWALFDPRNSDWALIATEMGVWSTDDLNGGSTDWSPTNSGLANVRVDMLQYRSSDRTIAAATHGRGLFTAVVPITTTPDICFASSSLTIKEQSTSSNGCRSYTDYSINMNIANAPAGDATVTVNIQSATATQGLDFDYTTNGNFTTPSNSFVFADGATSAKAITLRVYDDAEIEGPQSFTLNYSISGVTTAQAGSSNQTFTLIINDNDSAPTAASSANYSIGVNNIISVVTSPFQAGSRRARLQYLISAAELSSAGLAANRDLTALSWNVLTKNSTNALNGFTISLALTAASNLNTGFINTAMTQVYNANYTVPGTGLQTFNFSNGFNWDGSSNLLVQVCFDNANGSPVSTNDELQGTAAPFGAGTRATAINTATAGGTAGCSLGSSLISDSRPDFQFTQAIPLTPVETALNASKSTYLGPNSDVYFYSSADGELIARIRNMSSHDYGCTSIEIDRAGTNSSQFWNATAANYLMNKTFRVIPTSNNPSGQYEITLYLTQAEVHGWQSATGQSWNNIQMIKLPGQINIVTPSNPEPDGTGTVQVVTPTLGTLGTHYTMTYTFSNGFSGFGAGIPGASGTLPITLLNFSGKLQKENVQLNWITSFEQNSRGFEIEKSFDGVNFNKTGFVASAGNSNISRTYSFTDPQKAVEFNYYRLKMIDIDNTFEYSDIVLVKASIGKQNVFITENPFAGKLNLQFSKIPASDVSVGIYDLNGRVVYKSIYKNLIQSSIQLDLSNKLLSAGIYSVRIEMDNKVYNLKALKR